MKVFIVCLIVVFTVGACQSGNLTTLKDDELMARTTTANEARMTPDGNLQASYQGIGASQIMQDPNGNWAQMQGPVAIMSVPLPGGGVGYIISPKDTKIARLSYTPNPRAGETSIVMEGLEANISTPMAQEVAALQVALPILAEMTRTEALACIEKWKAAGTMMPTIADALIKIVGMWAPAVP